MNPPLSRYRHFIAAGCWALLAPVASSYAQRETPSQADPPAARPAPPVDYDSEPPYTVYERQWNRRFAAPYRRPFRSEYYPFGRPYYPRRYGHSRPYDYGYGQDYPHAVGYADYGTDVFDDGYGVGFHDGRRFQQWQTRAELGLNSYLKAMREGLARFQQGDYAAATRQFILAAKLNQGDAASRLRAVHAMTALGHYSAAVPALRRALQLQPKLVYLPLDIRSDYGPASDFDAHLKKLAESAHKVGDDAGLWLLLGYYEFFSDSAAEAVVSLTRAADLDPHDSAVDKLLEVARLSAPAAQPAESKPPPAKQGDSA
ncbi:MAG: hypothetical protein ACYSUI_16275 [Planctomycetota bacterium]|jgi:hypothetical protein